MTCKVLTIGKVRISGDLALLAEVHERQDEVEGGDDLVLLDAELELGLFENASLEGAYKRNKQFGAC